MQKNPLLERITLNPEICHGRPSIRNLRYPVASILEYLAAGDSVADILEEFTDLEEEDILACFAFAALLAGKKSDVLISFAA